MAAPVAGPAVDLRVRFYVVADGSPNVTYKAVISAWPRVVPAGWVWPAEMPEWTGTGPTVQGAVTAAWAAYKAGNTLP